MPTPEAGMKGMIRNIKEIKIPSGEIASRILVAALGGALALSKLPDKSCDFNMA